jgi:hypothetical protein
MRLRAAGGEVARAKRGGWGPYRSRGSSRTEAVRAKAVQSQSGLHRLCYACCQQATLLRWLLPTAWHRTPLKWRRVIRSGKQAAIGITRTRRRDGLSPSERDHQRCSLGFAHAVLEGWGWRHTRFAARGRWPIVLCAGRRLCPCNPSCEQSRKHDQTVNERSHLIIFLRTDERNRWSN